MDTAAFAAHLERTIPREIQAIGRRFTVCRGKKPVDPKTGDFLDEWNDPKHLHTWPDAIAYLRDAASPVQTIGLCPQPGDAYTVVDLDRADQYNGRTEMIIDRLGSYTETSMSNNGYHVIARGVPPANGWTSKNGIGIDIRKPSQHVVLTGNVVDGYETVQNGAEALTWLCETFLASETGTGANVTVTVTPPRRDLIKGDLDAFIRRTRQGERYAELVDEYERGCDRSAEGWALLKIVTGYTWDRNEIRSIFERSMLYEHDCSEYGKDPKWTRGDYLDKHITNAINECTWTYDPTGGIAIAPGGTGAGDKPRRQFAIYTRSELRNLPPPSWLIKSHFLDNGTIGISGMESTYKSFIAVSVACSVVTGVPWHGHEVKRTGPIIYLAGEGGSGIHKRIRAWELEHGIETGDDLIVLGQSINLVDGQTRADLTAALLEQLDGRRAVLVVADTLARMTLGESENSNETMTLFIDALESLCRDIGEPAAGMFIHHDSDAGKAFRGASSLRGNIDSTIHVEFRDGSSHVEFRKTKDFDSAPQMRLRPRVVPNADDRPGIDDDDRSSVVLDLMKGYDLSVVKSPEEMAYTALAGLGRSARYTAWKDTATAGKQMSEATFKRALNDLIKDKRVEKDGNTYRVVEMPEESTIAA